MSSKRVVFGFVFVPVLFILLYHFLWAADWTLKMAPEGKLRRAYIVALLQPPTPENLELIRDVEWQRRDVADGLIPRAALSVAGALALAGLVAFLPGRLRKRDDKHVRGAVIDDERTLRRRIEKEDK